MFRKFLHIQKVDSDFSLEISGWKIGKWIFGQSKKIPTPSFLAKIAAQLLQEQMSFTNLINDKDKKEVSK